MADETPGRILKIDKLFAWIGADASGGERVVGMENRRHGHITFIPLISADQQRVENFRDYAQAIGAASGCRIRLVEFSNRVDLGEA